ncbi:MAG: hypothetical protein WAK60_03970 [Sedimentisphaerales bacterium]
MIYAKLMLKNFQTKLNSLSAPFLQTLQPCKTTDIVIGILLFLAIFSAFASLCTKALMNGDAAVYVEQMQNLNFAARSVHIGYYLLGAAVIRIFPGSDDYAINLMSCFLGALTVAILYLTTLIICHKRIVALISSLFLLTNYIFLENSVFAEVYTPQLCFLLLALLLWLLDRPILASLTFALSLLISTSAVFALPLFFILRPRFRPYILFCAVILVIAVVVISPRYKDYFFSPRGLFTIALHQAFNLGFVLHREVEEVFFNFFLCIPFVVAGLIELFAQKKFRLLAIALLSLWFITLCLGEKNWNDFPVQFPTYALLCLVGGLGFHLFLRISNNKQYAAALSAIILSILIVVVVLIKVTKTPAQIAVFLPTWLLAATVPCAVLCMLVAILPVLRRMRPQVIIVGAVFFAVVINGFVAFSKLRVTSSHHVEYRNTIIEMSKVAAPDYIVVGGWASGILFEHYLFQKSYTPYWINTQDLSGTSGKQRQAEAVKKLNDVVAARHQIWLLENYSGLFDALQRAGYKIAPFKYIYVATAKD